MCLAVVILLEAGIFGTLLLLLVGKLLDIAADIWCGLTFRLSSRATAAAVAVWKLVLMPTILRTPATDVACPAED